MEFMREFPDDEACLRHLWRERYAPDGEHAHCVLVLPRLRLPHSPVEGNDLRALVHVASPLVLRDVLDYEHAMRGFREAP